MCRLFGIIANREVDIEFSFHRADKPFKSFSENNPDGWGIGYYSKEGKPEVFKQGLLDVNYSRDYNFFILLDRNLLNTFLKKQVSYFVVNLLVERERS